MSLRIFERFSYEFEEYLILIFYNFLVAPPPKAATPRRTTTTNNNTMQITTASQDLFGSTPFSVQQTPVFDVSLTSNYFF